MYRTDLVARVTAMPDAELTERASAVLRVCGYGTDSDTRMAGHLGNNPGHEERDLSRYMDVAVVVARSPLR